MTATIAVGSAANAAMASNSFFVGSVYSEVPAFGRNQETNNTRYVMINVKIILIMS